MPKKQIMPDLFVVMSNEELQEAIKVAKNTGAKEAIVYEGIQYNLSINKVDAREFILDTELWFPLFTDYIELSCHQDKIGILLSPTIWNHYTLDLLYKALEEENIKYKKYKNGFIDNGEFESLKEEERQASVEKPINSPWTARDLEVVEAALDTIEDIQDAIVIYNANFLVVCTFAFISGFPIPTKLPIAKFSYPNILHLETDNGYYNVYMGENIMLDDVLSLLKNRGIKFFIKSYSDEDINLLLYQSRNRKR